MPKTLAWGAAAAGQPLAPLTIDRREPGPTTSSSTSCSAASATRTSTKRATSGAGRFPHGARPRDRGPGHRGGAAVTKLAVGELAGVGCMVDSCRTCRPAPRTSSSSARPAPRSPTTAPRWIARRPPSAATRRRSWSTKRFTLRIPPGLDPAAAAPLLCAGITTYSPLRQWGCKPGDRVGVVGLGGLGHMAVKLAASMGAEVTVLSTSRRQGRRRAPAGRLPLRRHQGARRSGRGPGSSI
jgi:uncharacterized zinc-type alcohol dehydrogenase-like protein